MDEISVFLSHINYIAAMREEQREKDIYEQMDKSGRYAARFIAFYFECYINRIEIKSTCLLVRLFKQTF